MSTKKHQQAASGISDAPTVTATADAPATVGTAFTPDHLHRGGFEALELIRITNVTPLLWVRVDPHGLYNGRLNIFQQDGTRILLDLKHAVELQWSCTSVHSLVVLFCFSSMLGGTDFS